MTANYMLPYEVTALLCNAERLTGLPFTLDPDLECGEIHIDGDWEDPKGQAEGFQVSPIDPWSSVVMLATTTLILDSRYLSFLSGLPIVGSLFFSAVLHIVAWRLSP